MVAVADEPGHQLRVRLEVDPLDQRARREPGPFHEHELEPFAERLLSAPGGSGADDAPVHEDEPLHRAILTV